MIKFLSTLLGGDGVVKSIEKIALEMIETDSETEEAKTIMIKALDPNGKMRRDISNNVTRLYTLYLVTALVLLTCEFFGWHPELNDLAVSVATDKITELFLPISGLYGAIATASFGVNYANIKGAK
jgi:hypothetical protein